MSNQANIRDVQILSDLKTGFGRFGEDVSRTVIAIQKELEAIEEQLDERQKHWRHQTDQAENEVHAARQALSERENESDDDEGNSPDCSFEEDQVADAEKLLAENEGNLETVKQWRHRIESQIADFHNDMHRLSILASSRTGSAQAFLAIKIEILNRYIAGFPSVNSIGQVALHDQNNNVTLITSQYKPLEISPREEIHHIATDKNRISTAAGGPFTPMFEGLFEKAGMNLQDAINKLAVLGHRGPHPEYNRMVYERLSSAVEGLEGFAYEDAFQNELYAIAQESAQPGSTLNRLLTKKEND